MSEDRLNAIAIHLRHVAEDAHAARANSEAALATVKRIEASLFVFIQVVYTALAMLVGSAIGDWWRG